MRGDENGQVAAFSYVTPEERIPADHPLRAMRQLVNEALKGMSRQIGRDIQDPRIIAVGGYGGAVRQVT